MTTSHTRAAVTFAAPGLLAVALLWHPPIPGRLPNDDLIAEHVASDPTRWGLSHLATALASAVMILAFIAIRGYLREAGDRSISAVGLGLIVVGSTAYAVLPGMEFAPLAAHETGADPGAAQQALQPWFTPTLIIGGGLFFLGAVAVAEAIRRTGVLGSVTTLVYVALVVMAVSRLLPIGAFQFYVQVIAAFVALVPLAVAMWRHEEGLTQASRRNHLHSAGRR